MKKLCLVLVIYGFIVNLPSFAMKTIVNDNADRVVYSRSTSPLETASVYERIDSVSPNNNNYNNYQNNMQIKKNPYDTEYLRMIGNAIKPEFIGTRWDFYYENPENENITADANQNVIELSKYRKYELARSQRNSREAADYYTVIDNDTSRFIPSWEDDI